MRGPPVGKRGIEFITNWMGILFVIVLVASFFVAAVSISAIFNYVAVGFASLILGHFIHTSRYGNRFPYYVLSFGFVAGFISGNSAGAHTSSNILLLAIFILGLYATNRLAFLVSK